MRRGVGVKKKKNLTIDFSVFAGRLRVMNYKYLFVLDAVKRLRDVTADFFFHLRLSIVVKLNSAVTMGTGYVDGRGDGLGF